MIKLIDNTRISKFNFFYMLCIMVYLGYATVFARSLGNITTWGNSFALIITAVLIYVNKIRFNKVYFISIGIFLAYALATTINNGLASPMWIGQWSIWLTITYCINYTFKEKLFVVFETQMYYLCIVSLVCWLIHIISPATMENIVSTFQFSIPHGGDESNVLGNIIFYTINRGDINEYTFVIRNAGFAWEPGAYASYICLAIFCNSLRTNLELRKNKPLIIFIITLFSTQSTTGFATFLFMIGVWLIINRKIWLAFILIPVGIYMFQLPFVQDKILNEYNNIEYVNLSQTSSKGTYALGRMYSFILNWEEFLRHPIIGLGGWQGGTWLNRFGYDNIATISGIGEMLAMYGAIMTSLFLYLLIKSSRFIARTMSKNGYLLIVALIGMMFSYSMWRHPIYICFWMYAIYYPYKKVKQ